MGPIFQSFFFEFFATKAVGEKINEQISVFENFPSVAN